MTLPGRPPDPEGDRQEAIERADRAAEKAPRVDLRVLGADVCDSCYRYRVGGSENAVLAGVAVHACERGPEPIVWASACPCGCEPREPGRIELDREMFGSAYLNERGGRIDPTTVTTTLLRYSARRTCVFCGESHALPVEEERWTTVPLGGGDYWRCPDCTAEGLVEPRG